MRKPHARSVLKTLPFDRQQEIYDYLRGTKDTPPHTLVDTEAWLAAAGIETNLDSLSKFYHWFPLHSQLQAASGMGDSVKEILREIPGLDLDEEKLSKAGQAIFEAQALQAGDSKLFVALRQLRQNDRTLDLTEESGRTKARQKEKQLSQKDEDLKIAKAKFRRDTAELFADWYENAEAAKIMKGGGTKADKIEALGQAMFGEDW